MIATMALTSSIALVRVPSSNNDAVFLSNNSLYCKQKEWTKFGILIFFSEECQSGQFQCGNGLCVDGSKICDGIYDCVDAADERDCGNYEIRKP